MASSTSIKVSQMPDAVLPLVGDELVMIVQSGTSRKTPSSALRGSVATLGGEYAVALALGTTNNLTIPSIGSVNRLLCNTAAGAAILTGWTAGADGQLMVVTNQGPNTLTLPNQTGSDPNNQIYSAVDLLMATRQSRLFQYSGGLDKWVMV